MSVDLEKKAASASNDGSLKVALDLYKQAIAADPENADLYADCAQVNFKLKNYKEAVADADRAIQLDVSLDKAYLHRGNAYFKLGNFFDALKDFVMGFDLARDDVRFLARIGECQNQLTEQLNQLQGAAGYIETVDNASTDSDLEAENIFTVDHSSIGFQDDKPTGEELGDGGWTLEGRDDVIFFPFKPEIETALMDTLVQEVNKIKAKTQDKKKRLNWQERDIVYRKVEKHLATTYGAAVDDTAIELTVESYVRDASEIDELLKTGKFKWSEQEFKVMADGEVWETVSPYYARYGNESFPYYKGLKSLCYNLGIDY